MVRTISTLIGAAFVFVLALALFGTVKTAIQEPAAETVEQVFHQHPADIDLPSAGLFGKFDNRQVQRGFQVFKEVCSACHSLKYVTFRDLAKIGYTDPEIKAIASQWVIEQPSVNPDTGEPATRKNLPSDRFPSPFANDVAARAANNNALPPDLSLMAKARHDGSNYIHALLTGYRAQPAALIEEFPGAKTPEGLHYNPYFANLNIAMPPPLTSEGQVQYADGTKPTVDNMARDVSAFLVWAGDPNLETRHQYGFFAVIFLLISSFLAYGAYRNVWRDVKH